MMKPLSVLHTPRNNKGFSLIEVMVALGIFSIGILAVASMQISAAQGNLSARMRTEAITTAASFELESLILQPYALIDSGTNVVDGIYNLTWTVTEDSPINDTKSIELTVTWSDRGTTQSTTLNYIKANLDTY